MLALIAIFIFTKISKGSLPVVAMTYSIAPLVVYGAALAAFFLKHPALTPLLSSIRMHYAKDLMGLGVEFFIINIACLMVFSSSNILIAHLSGPESVTSYNIAFKYFSVITMIFNIILTPIWSAVTDAYTKNDFLWIKRTIWKLRVVWLLLVFMTLIMIAASRLVYQIWLDGRVEIPVSLSLIMGVYVTINNWNNIYAYFANGIGKIRVQLYNAIVMGIVYIPLVFIFNRYFGIKGILLAMCAVLVAPGFFLTMQYQKLMGNGEGKKIAKIWNT